MHLIGLSLSFQTFPFKCFNSFHILNCPWLQDAAISSVIDRNSEPQDTIDKSFDVGKDKPFLDFAPTLPVQLTDKTNKGTY